jgi:hypothetical protein
MHAATNSRHVPAPLDITVILQLVIQEINCIGHTKYVEQRVSLIFTMFKTFFAPQSI